jgi:hypothetical protein
MRSRRARTLLLLCAESLFYGWRAQISGVVGGSSHSNARRWWFFNLLAQNANLAPQLRNFSNLRVRGVGESALVGNDWCGRYRAAATQRHLFCTLPLCFLSLRAIKNYDGWWEQTRLRWTNDDNQSSQLHWQIYLEVFVEHTTIANCYLILSKLERKLSCFCKLLLV